MPSLNDIATLADALEKNAVAIVQDKCVVVRNRNARCRRCVEACAYGALRVAGNEVLFDSHSCVGCAACVGACPTEAIVALHPHDDTLDEETRKACEAAGGVCVIACDRMSARQIADPVKHAHVPCLARVGETSVLRRLSEGASKVILVDGDCSTCKYHAADAVIRQVVDAVNAMPFHGSGLRVERASSFPSELTGDFSRDAFGSTRRGFFSDAAAAAKETALTAARASISEKLGDVRDVPEIGERLRVGADGVMPRVAVPRHEDAVNALYDLGLNDEESVDSRLFGRVSVDVERCNACGMCVTFCPTGALARGMGSNPAEPLRELEFSASSCVQCRLCADVCWKGCITVEETVSCLQLFDFEPTSFKLPQSNKPRKSMFG